MVMFCNYEKMISKNLKSLKMIFSQLYGSDFCYVIVSKFLFKKDYYFIFKNSLRFIWS